MAPNFLPMFKAPKEAYTRSTEFPWQVYAIPVNFTIPVALVNFPNSVAGTSTSLFTARCNSSLLHASLTTRRVLNRLEHGYHLTQLARQLATTEPPTLSASFGSFGETSFDISMVAHIEKGC